jgi:hypothetical protein
MMRIRKRVKDADPAGLKEVADQQVPQAANPAEESQGRVAEKVDQVEEIAGELHDLPNGHDLKNDSEPK